MPKLHRLILCVFGAAIMAACAPDKTVPLERPVIRAEVLTVQPGTTIEPVSGTVYVTRDGEAIKLKESQAIEPDDLLQLAPDSAARLKSPGGEEFVLTPKHGEWFRFDIGKKIRRAGPQKDQRARESYLRPRAVFRTTLPPSNPAASARSVIFPA